MLIHFVLNIDATAIEWAGISAPFHTRGTNEQCEHPFNNASSKSDNARSTSSSLWLVFVVDYLPGSVGDTWKMRASCAHRAAICALHVLFHHVLFGRDVSCVGWHVVHSVSTARTPRAIATRAMPCQRVMEVDLPKPHGTSSADLPSRQVFDP